MRGFVADTSTPANPAGATSQSASDAASPSTLAKPGDRSLADPWSDCDLGLVAVTVTTGSGSGTCTSSAAPYKPDVPLRLRSHSAIFKAL